MTLIYPNSTVCYLTASSKALFAQKSAIEYSKIYAFVLCKNEPQTQNQGRLLCTDGEVKHGGGGGGVWPEGHPINQSPGGGLTRISANSDADAGNFDQSARVYSSRTKA